MKVLLVDDHALFRHGLLLLLKSRFAQLQIREAADLSEAQSCLLNEPDIGLLLLDVDLGLDGPLGLDTLQQCQRFAAGRPIVTIADKDDPQLMQALLAQGAVGFLPKTAQPHVFEHMLRLALAQGGFPDVSWLRWAAPQQESVEVVIDRLGLSPRQVEVLQLLVAGQSNKAICRELSLAESTIKTHLLGLFRKLGVSSRTEAVVAAVHVGLGQLPPFPTLPSREPTDSAKHTAK